MDDILGVVLMGDGVVGKFYLDEEDRITIDFNNEENNIVDMLEMAAENGMSISLAYQPDFSGYLPQHYKDV